MIDSSGTVGFDLEKARADMDAANVPADGYYDANARIVKIHMPGALAEIERLRALRSDIITIINRPKTTSDKGLLLYIRDEVDYNIRQATQIGDLETEIEMLQADAEQHERVIEARSEVINQQAARIKDLEDALVEERARWCSRENTGAQLSQAGDQFQKRCRRSARLQLQAEGKIGPGAEPTNIQALQRTMKRQHEPQYWQITDERVEALRGIYNEMVPLNAKSRHLPVLRAMLEASQ